MLKDDLRKRAAEAVKTQDAVARDVLRLALGELQTAESRDGDKPLSEADAVAIVRKLVKSNEETLAQTTDAERAATLRHELDVLNGVLPKALGPEQIAELLASQREAIRAAKTDGQATGLAMKHLKAAGADVNGQTVTLAVKQIREG